MDKHFVLSKIKDYEAHLDNVAPLSIKIILISAAISSRKFEVSFLIYFI